jgi:hypothetical protein
LRNLRIDGRLVVKWALSNVWGGKEMGSCERGNEHYAGFEPVRIVHFADIYNI